MLEVDEGEEEELVESDTELTVTPLIYVNALSEIKITILREFKGWHMLIASGSTHNSSM